ncbi:MAG: class I SAM-dependent methyltransferase [Thermoleophilaceae bacterium]|nr:class I SAM-dependent methyltransferase [Thermoleophilaceae bacterium]
MGALERLGIDAVAEATGLACEHVHRYELAREVVAGKRVVDLACGVGYGSALLAERASSVVGVDIDEASVRKAAETYAQPEKLWFETSDAGSWLRRAEPKDFDVLVCFEGLEHFPGLDEIAQQLARLAAGGVQMVLSVPNGEAFDEENEFHETQFGFDLAREFFAQIAPDYTLVLQSALEGSVMFGPNGPLSAEARLRWAERAEEEYANHYIALIGLEAEFELPATAVGAFAPAYNRHMINIERANRALWRSNAQLSRNAFARSGSGGASFLRSKLARLEELEAEVERLEAELAELRGDPVD